MVNEILIGSSRVGVLKRVRLMNSPRRANGESGVSGSCSNASLGVLSSESSLASNRFILLSNWAVNWANYSDMVFSRASYGVSMDDSS